MILAMVLREREESSMTLRFLIWFSACVGKPLTKRGFWRDRFEWTKTSLVLDMMQWSLPWNSSWSSQDWCSEKRSELEIDFELPQGSGNWCNENERGNPRERVWRREADSYYISPRKRLDKKTLVLSLYPKLKSPEGFVF